MDCVVETTASADIPPKSEQVNSLVNTDKSVIISDDSDVEMCSASEDKPQTVYCESVSPKSNAESSTAEDVAKVQMEISIYSQRPESLSFEDLLKDINHSILHVKFTQFLKFLESNGVEMGFPYISDRCEEVFRRIALDVNVLKSKCLGTCHRKVCDQIMAEVMINQSKYLLTSDYLKIKIRQTGKNKVLVIRKVFFEDKTDHRMLSLNQKELHTLSTINENKSQITSISKNENEKQNTPLLTTEKDLHSLNTTLSVNEKESQKLPLSDENKMNLMHVEKERLNTLSINDEKSKNNPISNEEKLMKPPLHGSLCKENKSLNGSSTLNNSMESLVSEASSTGSFTKSQRSPSVDSVPLEFKSNCLRTTLAFVKHKSDTNFIRYEELTFDQAKYVYEMVNSVLNNNEYNIIFGNKLLYSALCETVQIYMSDYKFKLDVVEFDLDKSTLVLQKMLKANPELNPRIVNTELPELLHNTPFKRKQLKKQEAATDFINRLPRTFVKDHLTKLVDFFSQKKSGTLVCQPKNTDQLSFCRKVLEFCVSIRPVVDQEISALFDEIDALLCVMKCKVPCGKKNKTNPITGIKEVTYKTSPRHPVGEVRTLTTRQKALQETAAQGQSVGKSLEQESDITEEIRKQYLKTQDSINKSPKKKKRQNSTSRSSSLVRTTNKLNFKSARDSSREDSERTSSCTRKDKGRAPVAQSSHRALSQERPVRQALERARSMYVSRNDQLREALSVPVQSDKAMKMMRGMGWSGGALGVRGDGITEPIMPFLDIVRGAGFGHGNHIRARTTISTQSRNASKWSCTANNRISTLKQSQNIPNWITESNSEVVETDVIVQKTKELLKAKVTFDSMLMPTNLKRKRTTKKERKEAFHSDLLTSILNLLSSKEESCLLKYKSGLSKKRKGFLRLALKELATRSRMAFGATDQDLVEEILEKYDQLPGVTITASVTTKQILLTKTNIFSEKQIKDITGMHTDDNDAEWIEQFIRTNMNAFLECPNNDVIKFKVRTLLKIISFLKSDHEELEVVFKKKLPEKEKRYIESSIEAANCRIKIGSSQAEAALSVEIQKYIDDYFLGVIFNHKYTSFTLIKYTATKSLTDSGQTSKPTCLSSEVNLDNFVKKTAKGKTKDIPTPTDINKKPTDINKNSEVINKNNKQVMKENISDHNINDDPDMMEINYEIIIDCQETVVDDTVEVVENSKCNDLIPEKARKPIRNLADIDAGMSQKIDNVTDEEITDDIDMAIDLTDYTETENSEDSAEIDSDTDTHQEIIDTLINTHTSKTSYTSTADACNDGEIDLMINNEYKINDDESISDENSLLSDKVIEANEPNINIETNCDKVNKKVDLSESNCVSDLVISDVKSVFDTDSIIINNNYGESHINNFHKSINLENKHVYIVPNDYPNVNIAKKRAIEIQKSISDNIIKTQELPLLMCHGVQKGALIYSCHSNNTYDWLKRTISVASDVKIIDTQSVQRMALKFYCLFSFDLSYLFKMIEMYNPGLSTKDWVVEETEAHDDYTIFLIKMDSNSVNFIHAADLALFVGIDKVEFSLIWD